MYVIKQMLYHSKTRWLSLYLAIERILQMFEPLNAHFLSFTSAPKQKFCPLKFFGTLGKLEETQRYRERLQRVCI